MKYFLAGLLGILFYCFCNISAQNNDYYISGFVTDAVTGEALVGTNLLLYKDSLDLDKTPLRGTAANKFGYYVIPLLSTGNYVLITRHIGYRTNLTEIYIIGRRQSETVSIQLNPKDIELEEVIIEGERQKETITSTVDVSTELLSKLPTLSGEIDLFKSLELLPGVNKSSEISSGIYVRGGSPDQTLTLVDGVIVYNPAHLGNIASTFNTGAVSDVRLIKGAYPAEYGGRLSSVLDIKLRSGTKEREKGTVGLGLINSFAAFEGPIGESSTYLVSGRVMYYDVLQKNFNKNSTIPRYNFYDLNAKVNYSLSESNIVSISGLFSKDHAYSPPAVSDTDYDIEWQNVNLSINWLQVNKKSLLLNSIVSFINYKFSSKIGVNPNTVSSYTYFSNPNITDFYIRQNAEFKWHQDHKFKTGFDVALHNYDILYSDIYNEALDKNLYAGKDITSAEASLYFQNESKFTNELSANLGGRFYYFGSKKFFRFEPRLSAAYNITSDLTLKGAFAIAHQFLHLIVRNDITLPTDLWYPSTGNIQPSKSTQYVFGFDSYWYNQNYLFSIESFYKDMINIYEFKNAPQLNPLDNSIEEQFTSGQGEAYGVELFLHKRKGKFSGWIGYTLSWSVRQFDELNGGRKFYSKYDRRHDLSLVVTYRLLEYLNIGLTWIYASGQRYTLPPGQFIFDPVGTGGNSHVQFNYTGLNTAQFPDYHKFDLNFNYSFRLFNSDFEAYINLYNIYNRFNAFAQYVVLQENQNGEQVPVLKRITLFPFIPSAGVSIKF
ncbi:MAG: TonB-dependent receptor [Ignavibacteria bacterium]|nr:TonB-dependent receptor [Ignavibacteria bacterium]MBT8382452.1 TonB-dependent receptor [Ignavibacteria bacterium]MBT8392829.1 TonB-dependent receptor [Ignavibacteria bacterium]NNJ53607.1 TonB-dependent receptor [Ignavibacteriaceae bacterium]NNL20214.1 TonB-dependent receptor [Ignavibacteriaceae bacterium]